MFRYFIEDFKTNNIFSTFIRTCFELITTFIHESSWLVEVKRLNIALRRFQARIEQYRSNMRAKLCFAIWHFRIFIVWECSKQSLNVISFLSFLMKFFKCHRFKKSLMTLFMKSFEIHSSSKKMNFEFRKNMFRIEYKTNLNKKKFLFVICLYKVRCSIIKEHWLIQIIFCVYAHLILIFVIIHIHHWIFDIVFRYISLIGLWFSHIIFQITDEKFKICAYISRTNRQFKCISRINLINDVDCQILNVLINIIKELKIINVYNEKNKDKIYTCDRILSDLEFNSDLIIYDDFNAHHSW